MSILEHRPADLVAQALVVEDQLANHIGKLLALPTALESSDAGTVTPRAWRCGGRGSCHVGVGALTLEGRAPARGFVPLASGFVPTMHRATPGTRTLPSFSKALTFVTALVRIRCRAGSSTC